LLELKFTGNTVTELCGNVLKFAQQMGFGGQATAPEKAPKLTSVVSGSALGTMSADATTADVKPAPKPTKPAKPVEPEPKKEPAKAEAAPEITYEQLRSLAGEKIVAGHKAEVSALIKDHGATKLSGVDPSEFASFKAELEAL
jgi:hypothetical protein